MHRRLAIAVLTLALSACGGAPGATAVSPTTSLTSASGQPAVGCIGGVPEATCLEAARVAVAAVAASGWMPTHVWIDSGQFCPSSDCLFDPNQNFPYPAPPDSGTWVANAEISFAQTDKHAGMNIATVGGKLVPVLIGYRVPVSSWCSGGCQQSAVSDGPFRLEIVLSHLDWKTSEAISGTAILDLGNGSGSPTTIYGSGEGVIAFSYAEVGGNRKVDPVWTADCGPHPLDPATPITTDLSKSGAVLGNEPDADFLRSFFADSQVHLPAGTWDITAIAVFADAANCAGRTHTMRATLRITVTD